MNETTIYWGKDIITPESQDIINALISKQKELAEEANKELKKLDIFHRGVSYYTRPMIGQSGDGSYTNYFEHEQRTTCENNVLESFM